MDEKDILIESAKKILEYCNKHTECNEDCIFYTEQGDHVCLFHTAHYPSCWDFNTIRDKSSTK